MARGLSEAKKGEVMGLLVASKSMSEAARLSKVSRVSVWHISKAFKEHNGNLSRKKGQGRKKTVVTKELVDKVRKRAERKPYQSVSSLARSMEMSRTSMRRVVEAAGLRSMSPKVQHEIFPRQEERRLERAMKLLAWRKKNKKIVVWSDEKLFYAETHVNKQNNRVLVPLVCADHTIHIFRKAKFPAKVMVFLAVGSDGAVMPPILFPANVTINSKVYQEYILIKVVKWMSEKYGQGGGRLPAERGPCPHLQGHPGLPGAQHGQGRVLGQRLVAAKQVKPEKSVRLEQEHQI